ncbi:MAG: VWA domain-containing protein [Ignavibacteriales bacterium]|nr:VWA domain-containing protein [Ignavibacteriales bacterium]
MKNLFALIVLLALTLFYAGCEKDDGTSAGDTTIPEDPTGVTVPTPTMNNVQPTPSTPTVSGTVVTTTLIGLIGNDGQPITLTYDVNNPQNSTIFLQEDGTVKGLKVTKVGTSKIGAVSADLVFVVDNSGSMGAEADSIAAGITEFANYLTTSGLDVRFAIVGYDDGGDIVGGLNFTNASTLSNYLNNRNYWGYPVSGTSRTKGFWGTDSATLYNYASGYASNVYNENGVVGCLWGYQYLSWRVGVQKVFINFTDEGTQVFGTEWTTDSLCNTLSGIATVHTVYTTVDTTLDDLNYHAWDADDERPWAMSWCTGGTIIFLPSNASGLNLKNLPFSTALINSYTVQYNGNTNAGSHTITITVKATNGDGKKTVTWTY